MTWYHKVCIEDYAKKQNPKLTSMNSSEENVLTKRGRGRPPGSSKPRETGLQINFEEQPSMNVNVLSELQTIRQSQEESVNEWKSEQTKLLEQMNLNCNQLDALERQFQRLEMKVDLIWSKFTFITPTIVKDLIMLDDSVQ